jgi:lysophospholipase L1-like esterase
MGYSRTGFEDQTLRFIVRADTAGSEVRIRLSNTFGNRPVTFDHAEIGFQDEGAAVVPGTNTLLTFGGEQEVMIPAGAMVYSDPVSLSVEPGRYLAVSLYTQDDTGPATWHPLGIETSYLAGGDDAGDVSGDPYTKELFSYYFLEGVDVLPKEKTEGAIVTLGNSITDGFQLNQMPEQDNPYPYYLAQRINDHPDVDRTVLNAGISGNRILSNSGTAGTNALARLNRDVIAQPSVTDVIILEGINDIGYQEPDVTAQQIIQGLKQIAIRCHAHGLDIYAGTLTPTRGAGGGYSSPTAEAKREMVNEFIRTGEYFDGVFDFDTAIQDPDQPDRILPKFDSGDHLHPSNAGYRKMAEIIDLSLFKNECQEKDAKKHHGRGHDHAHGSSPKKVGTPSD